MGEKWEIVTPGPPPPGAYEGRPGEGTIGARRAASTRKSPTKQEAKASRWTAIKRIFSLIPWGALLAIAFLFTGMSIFLAHAQKAADKSDYILALSRSDTSGLWPHRVSVFAGSYVVTASLAAGCMVAAAYLAIARLRQKLSKERKERWGKFKFSVVHNLGILSFFAIILPTIWFTLNCVFLSAWGMAMYTLRESIAPAVIAMQQADMSGVNVDAPVEATDGVCPAAGCLNLASYAWLESDYCLCTQPMLDSMQNAAGDAVNCVVWSLGGVGALWFGALLAAAQGAADLALLKSEWLASAPRASRSNSSPAKRAPIDEYGATPGSALPKMNLYQVNGYGAGGPGYYVRSPPPGGYV